jgi:hypothetical protein
MSVSYSNQSQNYFYGDSSLDANRNSNSSELSASGGSDDGDELEPRRLEPQKPRIRIFNKFQPSLTAQPRRSALKNGSTSRIQSSSGSSGNSSSRNKLKNVLFKTMPYKSLFSDLSTVYEEADDLFWANQGSQYFSAAMSPSQLKSLSQVMKSSRVDFGENSSVNSTGGTSPSSAQSTHVSSRRAIEIITPMRSAAANATSLNNYLQSMLANSSSINNLINNSNNSNVNSKEPNNLYETTTSSGGNQNSSQNRPSSHRSGKYIVFLLENGQNIENGF